MFLGLAVDGKGIGWPVQAAPTWVGGGREERREKRGVFAVLFH